MQATATALLSVFSGVLSSSDLSAITAPAAVFTPQHQVASEFSAAVALEAAVAAAERSSPPPFRGLEPEPEPEPHASTDAEDGGSDAGRDDLAAQQLLAENAALKRRLEDFERREVIRVTVFWGFPYFSRFCTLTDCSNCSRGHFCHFPSVFVRSLLG